MTLLSIQYLRAIASLMVVFVHLQPQWSRMGFEAGHLSWLISGVDIFFVISGFIMWQTTQGRSITPREFYRRRIQRIVPLYWLLTSIVLVVLLLAPNLLQSTRFDAWHIVSSYLFIPSVSPANGLLEPLLVPGWTLNFEMFFYLLFGLSLWLPERRRLAGLSTVMCLLVAAQIQQPAAGSLLAFYSSSIILEFLLGIMLGALYQHQRLKLLASTATAILIGGIILLFLLSELAPALPRVIKMGIPALMVVAAALSLEPWCRKEPLKLALRIGTISYSLYLSHPLVLSAVSQAWRKLGWDGYAWSLPAFSAVAVLICLVAAQLVFTMLEQPLTRFISAPGSRPTELPAQPHRGAM